MKDYKKQTDYLNVLISVEYLPGFVEKQRLDLPVKSYPIVINIIL
jgi:hypothetical protein